MNVGKLRACPKCRAHGDGWCVADEESEEGAVCRCCGSRFAGRAGRDAVQLRWRDLDGDLQSRAVRALALHVLLVLLFVGTILIVSAIR